jgi:hypothetical protein
VTLVLVWSMAQPNADDFQNFASQYVILTLLLAGAALVVSWPGRAGPRALRAGVLVVLLADLLFGSYAVTDSARNPDIRPLREREWVEAIGRTSEPLRLSRADRIHPTTFYRNGWGIVDGESTFAPAAFLELYALSKDHPQLLDLLNVRFVLPAAAGPPAPPKAPGPLRFWPGAVRRLPSPPATARQLQLDSHLVHGLAIPQGQVVATVRLGTADGTVRAIPLRAGVETAEWALDRPGAPAGHSRPPIARSWPTAEGYPGHTYRATIELPKGATRITEVVLEGGSGPGLLVVERAAADGATLWPPASAGERFRPIMPGLFENVHALPRAFLVRRARSIPTTQILEQLRDLDPREEVLVTDPLPPSWTAAPHGSRPPLPPVRVVSYGPAHVVLEVETPEPAVLVLSDTFDPRWRASDNGQPVPIVRADHALRAVFLAPGRHRVEFRYRQPSVYVGLGVTLATLGVLGAAGLVALRRGRRAATPP